MFSTVRSAAISCCEQLFEQLIHESCGYLNHVGRIRPTSSEVFAGEDLSVLPFISFLAIVMVALGVIGTTITGISTLTVIAAVCLGLTVVLGSWTLSRQRDHL